MLVVAVDPSKAAEEMKLPLTAHAYGKQMKQGKMKHK